MVLSEIVKYILDRNLNNFKHRGAEIDKHINKNKIKVI